MTRWTAFVLAGALALVTAGIADARTRHASRPGVVERSRGAIPAGRSSPWEQPPRQSGIITSSTPNRDGNFGGPNAGGGGGGGGGP